MVNTKLLQSMLEFALDLRRMHSCAPDARIGKHSRHLLPELDVDACSRSK